MPALNPALKTFTSLDSLPLLEAPPNRHYSSHSMRSWTRSVFRLAERRRHVSKALQLTLFLTELLT
jgi:hypothetical protein